MNVRNSFTKVVGEAGDLITIVEPWIKGEDYKGLITSIDEKYVYVYHGCLNKKLMWNRYVNCIIEKYNADHG